MQAGLPGVSRSSLSYTSVPASAAAVAIKHRIDELYTAHPFYVSRCLRVSRQREGLSINRQTVQRYMRETGIVAICPGPNLSPRELAHRVYPYCVVFERPSRNPIRGIDITYVRLVAGWLYLVAVLDWYSRYVVGWELSDSLEIKFVPATADRALLHALSAYLELGPGQSFHQPAVHRATARRQRCRSAWMAKAARWTTSLLNGCGAPSSMKRSIFMITPRRASHGRG